jgi:hypothetical protein
MDRDIDREDESEEAPAAGPQFRAKLKVVAHYALLASPLIGLLGIILAVTALVLGRFTPPPDDSRARIESLSSSLAETKSELESLKFILARERAARVDERKEDDARSSKVVKHVSDLEKRQKISPTLEEALQQAPVAPAAPPAGVSNTPAPAVAPASVEKKAVPAPAPVPSKPAAAVAPVEKRTAPAPASSQVKSLKEAIEKFNETPPKKR